VQLATSDRRAGSASQATRAILATPALQEAVVPPDLGVRRGSVEIPGGPERAELLELLDPLVQLVRVTPHYIPQTLVIC